MYTYIMRITKKFRDMCEVYKLFSKDWKHILDYSEDSLVDMFRYESHGYKNCKPNNGYLVGKKWLNVFVDMWKEDITAGILFVDELYDDPFIPDWWLDNILETSIHT